MHDKMISYAKIGHSDAVVAHGPTSVQAETALEIVKALSDVPAHPVKLIMRGTLERFVQQVHTLPTGMRVGGENPPDRLNAVLAEFCESYGIPEDRNSGAAFGSARG